MLNSKKVIAFDLDGTLAESKTAISPKMVDILTKLLDRYFVAVISGGSFVQFEKQFLSGFSAGNSVFNNLYIFPTMGAACYIFKDNKWTLLYEEKLTQEETEKIEKSFLDVMDLSGMDLSGSYGDILENRGTQVTFSGRGQNAPFEVKSKWDIDGKKRMSLVSMLKNRIPEFEIKLGGMTSIDVTRKGVDKAYAIEKIKDLLKVSEQEILFIGDALYDGGNDSAIKKTSVDFIQTEGPDNTIEILKPYLL